MEILKQVKEFWAWAESVSDPRVSDWPFVPSPIPTYSLVVIYVLCSYWIGPKFMSSRQPFDLKWCIVIYNALMTALNFYIFEELVVGAVDAGFSFPCQICIVSNDPKHMRIASALWWYYFSKIIEFLDTAFFVLRKKQSHVTFLHVYHHATMPLLWWSGIKWVPCGLSTYGAMLNSFVHIVMYTYYGLAALGPKYQKYLWWKRYLTQLQLIQFCIALGHSSYDWYTGCPFPTWMYITLIFYMISFLILFGNFYVQAYLQKNRTEKVQKMENVMKASIDASLKNGYIQGNDNIKSKSD